MATTMTDSNNNSLAGKFLVALPTMKDQRFNKAVIYLCVHNEEGAMGLIVNKKLENLTFDDLLDQLSIESGADTRPIQINVGGPVESGRGFILHSNDYQKNGTHTIQDEIALTATVDILDDIANGMGPDQFFLALGYAGWGAGQLDAEVQANSWLVVDADSDLLFSENFEEKWNLAASKLGFDINMLMTQGGHA